MFIKYMRKDIRMKSIAIIPARGGSKRIPGKNIKDFCGKPIIAYSIQAALDSHVFETVMVSTDSKEIAEIAKKYGAEVPFYRSEETSSDYASTASVVMEVLREYEKIGKKYESACCLYPTAPFLTADIIKEAENMMDTKKPAEIIGVVEFSYPPQRAYNIGSDGLMQYKYKEYINARSQDLEKLYHDAGQFYIYNVREFYRLNGRIAEGIMPIILSQLLVQDIDTEDDWKLAELKYNYWRKDDGNEAR